MMRNNLRIIILLAVIFLISISFVSAATKYWLGDGVNLAIKSDAAFIIDTVNNRVGIGDPTPDYTFDVNGTGNLVNFQSTSGDSLHLYGVTRGLYAVNSASSGIAVYGEVNLVSSGSYGVYGRTNSASGYSGYFTGGSGLYVDTYEAYHAGNCRYYTGTGTGETLSVSCGVGTEEVVGGGCNCECGSSKVGYSRPNTGLTQWQCYCPNCGS
ncbi:hypothetical protein KY336_00715, partial [Candidatus Woesearchaeota archaeon]|nr:hypothetical protein [Candidatus Woesearchaeota archaeon]